MKRQGYIGAMRALENDSEVLLDTHGQVGNVHFAIFPLWVGGQSSRCRYKSGVESLLQTIFTFLCLVLPLSQYKVSAPDPKNQTPF